MSSDSPRQQLTIAQARAMVEDLIAKGERLFVEGKSSKPPEQLGPITRDFFAMHGMLRTRRGGFQISVPDIRASDYMSGYLSIGHSEDWDVVLRPGSDEVFVIEGSETCDADMQVRFASVYHLIIDESERA